MITAAINTYLILFWDQNGEQKKTVSGAKTMTRALKLFETKHNPLLTISITLQKK